MHVRFAPPSEDAQLFVSEMDRETDLDFPGRDTVHIGEHVRTTQRETFDPQTDGGWRVTSMLLDELAKRNGVPVASAVPLKGVPFVARIDAKGRFVRAEDVDETIAAIEANAPTKVLHDLMAPLLTPKVVARRIAEEWRRRTTGLCNSDLTPGQTFFGLDTQGLPMGGPAVSVVKATVIGESQVGIEPAVEVALEFGGASSRLAREAGAEPILSKLEPGVLTGDVTGRGVRYISLDTCQVLLEKATLDGAWTLNEKAVGKKAAKAFPKRIRFRVSRTTREVAGPEAAVAQPMP